MALRARFPARLRLTSLEIVSLISRKSGFIYAEYTHPRGISINFQMALASLWKFTPTMARMELEKRKKKKKKRGTINSNTLSDVFVRLEIETRGKRWKGSFEFSIQWPCYFIRRSLIFYYFYLLIQIIPSKPNGSLLAWNKNSPNQLRAERTIRYFRKATLPRTIEENNTHEIIFPALFLYKFTLRSLFYSKSFAIHYDFSIMFIGCDIGACYVLIQNIARFRINIKQILHAWLKRGRGERKKKKKRRKATAEKWLLSYEEINIK